MADRRAVRSSSRRITPTPQPPSKLNTPQTGRTTRKRGTRSASRDVELPPEDKKPTRRSARQASEASAAGENENAVEARPKTTRKAYKEPVADLSTVEEVDTQLPVANAPSTPPRPDPEVAVSHRSPGAVSEMSGTTAISSFSMVEAELLEARFIIRTLPKLYESESEFLEHLVPVNGRLDDDHQHIRDMQMPDSSFSADYRYYDEEVTLHLNHFRGEHQRYIHIRAVHYALFGPNRDMDAARCGLDPVLYLANLLIFAKQMIHSSRNEKEIWDALRELDNTFPALFLPALILGCDATSSAAGDSALLQETFELALDLRTQLAILWLERSSNDNNFDPDEAIMEVFLQSDASAEPSAASAIRGWGISALGGEDSILPEAFQSKFIERFNIIREFFPTDDESLERGEVVDIDGLSANFPWESVILRLLHWVRLRTRELQGAIEHHGGVNAIIGRVKTEMEQPSGSQVQAHSVARASPRKKRASFGRARRRSSRRFDPNADLNNILVDKLIAKERGGGAPPPVEPADHIPEVELQEQEEAPVADQEETAVVEEINDPIEDQEDPPIVEQEEVPITQREIDDFPPPIDLEQDMEVEAIEEPIEESVGPSRPPQSAAETLKLLKEDKRLDKENRAISLFERQETAQRVEFGDGFDDSQPSSGPSKKGKQAQRTSPKKRRRAFQDSSDDEDAFQTEQRTSKVQERREKTKRVRIDPNSSSAPTSHQPPPRDEDLDFQPPQQNESPSETEAPEMTEEAPPSSTFEQQKKLARANARVKPIVEQRKARTAWSAEAEQALMEYMEIMPQKYSQILQHDDSEAGYGLLEGRTQVNLKDKVRNMAIVMIKSGAGLRPGFDNVITPESAIGRKLVLDGFDW